MDSLEPIGNDHLPPNQVVHFAHCSGGFLSFNEMIHSLGADSCGIHYHSKEWPSSANIAHHYPPPSNHCYMPTAIIQHGSAKHNQPPLTSINYHQPSLSSIVSHYEPALDTMIHHSPCDTSTGIPSLCFPRKAPEQRQRSGLAQAVVTGPLAVVGLVDPFYGMEFLFHPIP